MTGSHAQPLHALTRHHTHAHACTALARGWRDVPTSTALIRGASLRSTSPDSNGCHTPIVRQPRRVLAAVFAAVQRHGTELVPQICRSARPRAASRPLHRCCTAFMQLSSLSWQKPVHLVLPVLIPEPSVTRYAATASRNCCHQPRKQTGTVPAGERVGELVLNSAAM